MTCLDVQRFPMQRHSHRQRAGLNSREPRLATLETSPKLSGRHVCDSLESSAERGVAVVAHRPSSSINFISPFLQSRCGLLHSPGCRVFQRQRCEETISRLASLVMDPCGESKAI
jgi:hypothetical protein